MALLANVFVVVCLGLMPDAPAPGQVVQTTLIVPDGGTVLVSSVEWGSLVPTSSSIFRPKSACL
jgi:hypothetical protein